MTEQSKNYGSSDHPMTKAELEAEPKVSAESAEPKVMAGLTEGRMVHYVLDQGHYKGEHRAAVITRIWDHGQGYCNLTVFVDGSNDGYDPGPAWITSVEYSEEPKPRTWHWIEKA